MKIFTTLSIPVVSITIYGQPLNLIDIGDNSSGQGYKRFSVLDAYIKDKDIIMLGEQSHREGTTLQTKYELIKYLHEYHDFDLLLFESDFYGGQKTWEDILLGANPGEAFARSIFFIWSATEGFQEFSKYINNQLEAGDTL